MRRVMFASMCLLALASAAAPAKAQETVWTGAAIGAGSGLLIAGPPGAVVGGIIGAVVRGPRVTPGPRRWCWTDVYGRHCRYR
jgi:hypothetical protein